MFAKKECLLFHYPSGMFSREQIIGLLTQQIDEFISMDLVSGEFPLSRDEYLNSYIYRIIKLLEKIPLDVRTYESISLDVGCGEGQLMFILKSLGMKIEGVDNFTFKGTNLNGNNIEPLMRKYLSEKELVIKEVDIEKEPLPYPDQYFDLVICNAVIEHLHNSPKYIIQEMKRTLKPNGYLIVNVPNYASLERRLRALRGLSNHENISKFYNYIGCFKDDTTFLGHIREYTVDEMLQIFIWEGCKIIHWETFQEKPERSIYLKDLPRIWVKRRSTGIIAFLETVMPKFGQEILVIGQKKAE